MLNVLASSLLLALAGAAPAPAPASPGASAPVPTALYEQLRWRLVGPYRAGWATAVAGIPEQPTTFYFGGAGGGVWKTLDAGLTWEPLMQHESASAVGALAIAPSNPNILYVGTGQPDARYDIMAGEGVFRSSDGGEHWTHLGLERTRHIGALLVDPRNPDRVLVGAMGHIFGPNPERGVFLTTDGGKTWRKTLYVNDSTGVVDLAWDPGHPGVLYAAAWQARMHPWLDYFQPLVGPGSGIYKSLDGGEHWTRLASPGIPAGPLGRIGLAVAPGSEGRIVYALIDAEKGAGGLFRSSDGGASWMRVNGTPGLASSYFGRLTVAPSEPETVYVMGQSIRRSTNGGRSFEWVKGAPGGDDYHVLWINPRDPSHMVTGSDQGAAVTVNAMKHWTGWYNQPTGQFYHLAADDRFPYHIYSGQQDNGTVEIASRGPYGVIEERDWHPVGGDERDYMVPQPGKPSTVFGSGLGGHLSRFDEVTRQSAEVSPWPVSTYGARPTTVKYRYTWITPLAFSPFPPHELYVGAQVLFRSTDEGNQWSIASPDLSGKRAGAKNCEEPNPDPVTARDCGYGVIYAIAPSPRDKDVLWVGTDDGLVQLTRDGGAHWKNVTPKDLPVWAQVDVVEPSSFDVDTAYLAVDTHRLNRFEPMLRVTHDGGASWRDISHGIPAGEFTTVVRADPVRRGLLYAGTNRAVYVSFDEGANWQPLSLNLPTTWYRDLLVHGDDLIAATQGRGIWVLDDLAPLRTVAANVVAEPLHLFPPAVAIRMRANESHDTPPPPGTPLGENPPTGAVFDFWIGSKPSGPVTLTIRDAAGKLVRSWSSDEKEKELPARQSFEEDWLPSPNPLPSAPGAHRFVWDLRYPRPPALHYEYSIAAVFKEGEDIVPEGPFVLPGKYTATLAVDGRSAVQPFEVKLDPRVNPSEEALRAQLALSEQIGEALSRAVEGHEQVKALLTARGAGLSEAARKDVEALLEGKPTNFDDVASVLAHLVTAVQSADAAPNAAEQAVYREYLEKLAGLEQRWAALRKSLGVTRDEK